MEFIFSTLIRDIVMSIDAIESGPKKRPALSIPFLVTAVTIGGICYLVGPWIMTQYFYQQEQSIAAELYSGKFKPRVGFRGGVFSRRATK